ncbi:MAG: EAL domain-containing protein [Lachnospiraceae bacterium]
MEQKGIQMIDFADMPLNDEMRRLLDELKIDFAFQPIFKAKTMEVTGYEALMRPVGSTPMQLIQHYRMKNGLHTLELATFLGACKAYYKRNLKELLSINSFPSECFNEEESAVFFQCFPHIAEKMFVEILEYTDLDYDKWVLKREQIRSNGICISLDDYGTGNNSMEVVNIFEPEEIKIDRSLIEGIHLDTGKQTHFLELVDQFHRRGIQVLAEGIESKEELDYLLTTDVDFLQGYYLGRPE